MIPIKASLLEGNTEGILESGNWDAILEKIMLQSFLLIQDENTGADFIRDQIKTISVRRVLGKLVFVYTAEAKDRKFIIRKIPLLKCREST